MIYLRRLLPHQNTAGHITRTLSCDLRLACNQQQAHLVGSSAIPSMENSDHAVLTSASPRQPVLADAQIREVQQSTQSVKRLRLHVDDERFAFQPGQWVDFHAPGVTTIGGYSVVSPPSQLTNLQTFDIAVKESMHPPAHWVHTQAAAGTPVKVQIGGNFVLSSADMERPLLFLAGGIGITPIMSMLSHYVEAVPSLLQRSMAPCATLLYSASKTGELAFKMEIDHLQKMSSGALNVTYYVTREAEKGAHEQHVKARRMNTEDMTDALQQSSACHVQVGKGPVIFLCGPPGMINHFINHAKSLGISSKDLRSEQWW